MYFFFVQPITLVVVCFCIFWSETSFCSNPVLERIVAKPSMMVEVALGKASAASAIKKYGMLLMVACYRNSVPVTVPDNDILIFLS